MRSIQGCLWRYQLVLVIRLGKKGQQGTIQDVYQIDIEQVVVVVRGEDKDAISGAYLPKGAGQSICTGPNLYIHVPRDHTRTHRLLSLSLFFEHEDREYSRPFPVLSTN